MRPSAATRARANDTHSPIVRSRLLALDALRGIAVLLMIEQHVGAWLWQGPGAGLGWGDYPVFMGLNALGGAAAPLFVTLAGIGAALLAASGRTGVDAVLARRGLVLLALGYLLNLATPSWFSLGSWFVLHLLGACLLTAVFWRRLSTPVLLAATGLILAATAAVQSWLDTPWVLDNLRMRRLDLPGGPLRLLLAEGHFPLLPWLGLFLPGLVTGRWLVARNHRAVRRLALAFLAGGATLVLLGATDAGHRGALARAADLHPGFYPASAAFVALMACVVLGTTLGALRWDERRPLRATAPLVTLGRASLTLLVLHVVLFRELGPRAGLYHALPAAAALALTLGVCAVATVLTRLWARGGYRYGAEWLLRRVGG